MPLFSIVVPTYNRLELLKSTLLSIAAQTFSDYEVIVVDDGSQDDVASIVARFGPQYRLVRQPNRGPGQARNCGIRHATGRYVAFLDSDDLWCPWSSETYARAIRQHHEPAFLAGIPKIFYDERELQGMTQGPFRTEAFPDYYHAQGPRRWCSTSSLVVRRDVLLAVHGFARYRMNGEDSDLTMRLGAAEGFVHVASPVTFAYREHPQHISANVALLHRGAQYMVRRELRGRYPGGAARRAERIAMLAPQVAYCLKRCAYARPWLGWSLFARTFGWQLRRRDWETIFLYPVRCLCYFPQAVWSVIRKP